MAKFIINGGKKLSGKVKVAGNKNSTFGLFAASLLANSPSTLSNVPKIRDVEICTQILEKLGCKISWQDANTLTIDPKGLSSFSPDPALAQRTRGAIVFAAPLFARFGKVVLPRPGGDSIGERLVGPHMKAMSDFGAKTKEEKGFHFIQAAKIAPANIFLEEASVTATEIALIVAASLSGETIIEDAACEPHVVDLCEMLSKMGAKITGIGTNTLCVKGGKNLHGVEHTVRPDHIEAGTFAIAAAITKGDVIIQDARQEDLKMTLLYLSGMGLEYEFDKTGDLRVKPSMLVAERKKFQTRPWPGFPTDMMSPFIVFATQAKGTVICHDWMYEWRIFFVDHLISMGASIIIADPHRVIVNGPAKLHGEVVPSADIRAGCSLVLAGLAAEGETIVEHAEVIDRGYEKFEERLAVLGADIKRLAD